MTMEPLGVLLDRVQAKINATPMHPMYDIGIDRKASMLTFDVVLEWVAAVQWNAETMKVKHAEWRARLNHPSTSYALVSAAQLDEDPRFMLERAHISGSLATSAMLVDANLDDMWPHLLRHLDHNFLAVMSNIRLESEGMRWQTDRWTK